MPADRDTNKNGVVPPLEAMGKERLSGASGKRELPMASGEEKPPEAPGKKGLPDALGNDGLPMTLGKEELPETLGKLPDALGEEEMLKLGEQFFRWVAERYRVRSSGVYHPDPRIMALAEKNGLVCLPVHFYSPIPSREDITRYDASRYGTGGIDWNDDRQLDYLRQCAPFEKELLNCPKRRRNGADFYWDNDSFSYSDAAFYYSLIRIARPRKIVEIGAGSSTRLAVRAIRQMNANPADILDIIEPFPSKDVANLAESSGANLMRGRLQDVPLAYFRSLGEGDILFYDGSHVSKYGSDVNYFMLSILPELNSGVYVHVHDIFMPDDMPKEWVEKLHLYWNEQYVLHAFLMYNRAFEIIFASHYLSRKYKEMLDRYLTAPAAVKQNGGASIWLRKASAPAQ